MDRLNSSLRLYNNNLTRAVMLRTQRQRGYKASSSSFSFCSFVYGNSPAVFFSLCVRD
jgi:hypothetical protein